MSLGSARDNLALVDDVMEFVISDQARWIADVLAVHDERNHRSRKGQCGQNGATLIIERAVVDRTESRVDGAGFE
jgi:hypothetical protein